MSLETTKRYARITVRGEVRDEPVTIAQGFPFLERLLSEAEEVWRQRGKRRLRSDPFVMTDSSGVVSLDQSRTLHKLDNPRPWLIRSAA